MVSLFWLFKLYPIMLFSKVSKNLFRYKVCKQQTSFEVRLQRGSNPWLPDTTIWGKFWRFLLSRGGIVEHIHTHSLGQLITIFFQLLGSSHAFRMVARSLVRSCFYLKFFCYVQIFRVIGLSQIVITSWDGCWPQSRWFYRFLRDRAFHSIKKIIKKTEWSVELNEFNSI